MTPKKMGPYLEDEEISMDERTALGVQDGHGCGGEAMDQRRAGRRGKRVSRVAGWWRGGLRCGRR